MNSHTNGFGQTDANRINEEDSDSSTGEKLSKLTRGFMAESFSARSPSVFDFGGRSYVTNRGAGNISASPIIHSGVQVHEQTANLASIGVTDDDSFSSPGDAIIEIDNNEDISPKTSSKSYIKDSLNSSINMGKSISHSSYPKYPDYEYADMSRTIDSPLLVNSYTTNYTDPDSHNSINGDLESGRKLKSKVNENANSKDLNILAHILKLLPSVFLGTLLNILDGLSYGMIMFPVSTSLFSSLAPDGLSMFYMSCIVSQLVYSLGGSAFGSGIGSEMIEVTPFFHTMALSIMADIGSSPENASRVISTTIVTYAFSSILTGLVFYLLGKLRLGVLVGFFPRHILVGCIGGVGYFLVVTGLEVSARLSGGFNFGSAYILFQDLETILKWSVPVIITFVLIWLQHKVHNNLLIPMFYITVFAIFHLIVLVIPSWNLSIIREKGWLFPAVEDDKPWYSFYHLYSFREVEWLSVLRQIPTMFALTFFGILHVPINVPALAVTLGIDNFDVDRELVAHGYSNVLSGMVGSIQNYLVYTNSVLFIRAGADGRLAGVLLALATTVVMVTGPVVIGYIPVCVVASLIFLLGYELLKEALYDTWGRVSNIEYLTILTIVIVMGSWDFVYGVLTGIILASLLFVIEAGRRSVVRGVYTGTVARSTVLRHPKQQEFLKNVGNQICIVKLEGTLFFGSIGGLEKVIRRLVDDKKSELFSIKFLILDVKGVASIDYSAAEGFRRILNVLNEYEIQLIISSVQEDAELVKSLRDAGLWEQPSFLPIQLFSGLNYALEWCENSFLKTYGKVLREETYALPEYARLISDQNKQLMGNSLSLSYGTTPRTKQVFQAAAKVAKDEENLQAKFYAKNDLSFKKQPLALLMTTFSGLSDKDESFWSKLTPFLIKEHIPANFTFYRTVEDQPSFFVVESGLIRSVFKFETDGREMHSSILPLTAFGDTYPKSSTSREIIYTTVTDTVTWRLSKHKTIELLKSQSGQAIYTELLRIQVKLVKERFDTMTANLVISS